MVFYCLLVHDYWAINRLNLNLIYNTQLWSLDFHWMEKKLFELKIWSKFNGIWRLLSTTSELHLTLLTLQWLVFSRNSTFFWGIHGKKVNGCDQCLKRICWKRASWLVRSIRLINLRERPNPRLKQQPAQKRIKVVIHCHDLLMTNRKQKKTSTQQELVKLFLKVVLKHDYFVLQSRGRSRTTR